MKEKSRKLKLTRETVRLLSTASARKVAGGWSEGGCESDMTQPCILMCITEEGFCHSDNGTCNSEFFGCQMGSCGGTCECN